MDCEVNGSTSCNNKRIENWGHGMDVFLFGFDSGSRFEGSVSVAAAGFDFVILPVAETRWPPRRGVSSSGTVGVVMVMRIRSVGGSYKKRWERESKRRTCEHTSSPSCEGF